MSARAPPDEEVPACQTRGEPLIPNQRRVRQICGDVRPAKGGLDVHCSVARAASLPQVWVVHATREEGSVRVRFQNTDGLVFLSRVKPPVALDDALLGETDRLNLQQLVRAARFFDLPDQTPSNINGGPAWYITIEDAGRQHSVKVGQPVQGPAMRRLVERLRKLGATEARKVKRAKGGQLTAPLVSESPVPRSSQQADRQA